MKVGGASRRGGSDGRYDATADAGAARGAGTEGFWANPFWQGKVHIQVMRNSQSDVESASSESGENPNLRSQRREGGAKAGRGRNLVAELEELDPQFGPGIGWTIIGRIMMSQLVTFALFHWLAGPLLRAQLMASVTWSAAAAGSGALAALPLMLTGWVAEKVHLDWLDEVREITREFALILFGTKRKVAAGVALAVPLGIVVGFVEECAFRGYLPLILTAKTGLPTAAVVGISSVIFGALHAATLVYVLEATIAGIYFHSLLLCTGNIMVPIVAHALYDAVALLYAHVKSTQPK